MFFWSLNFYVIAYYSTTFTFCSFRKWKEKKIKIKSWKQIKIDEINIRETSTYRWYSFSSKNDNKSVLLKSIFTFPDICISIIFRCKIIVFQCKIIVFLFVFTKNIYSVDFSGSICLINCFCLLNLIKHNTWSIFDLNWFMYHGNIWLLEYLIF